MLKKFSGDHGHHIGIFALRIAIGLAFIIHGWLKIQGMAGTIHFFATLGLPAFVAYLVAMVEFGGGILIFLGIGTEYVTLPIIIDMVCAIFLTGAGRGILAGHELEVLLLGGAIALAFLGSGKYSVDAYFSKS